MSEEDSPLLRLAVLIAELTEAGANMNKLAFYRDLVLKGHIVHDSVTQATGLLLAD